jgi:hypothetical protein
MGVVKGFQGYVRFMSAGKRGDGDPKHPSIHVAHGCARCAHAGHNGEHNQGGD